jgi:hypothetical protein
MWIGSLTTDLLGAFASVATVSCGVGPDSDAGYLLHAL